MHIPQLGKGLKSPSRYKSDSSIRNHPRTEISVIVQSATTQNHFLRSCFVHTRSLCAGLTGATIITYANSTISELPAAFSDTLSSHYTVTTLIYNFSVNLCDENLGCPKKPNQTTYFSRDQVSSAIVAHQLIPRIVYGYLAIRWMEFVSCHHSGP